MKLKDTREAYETFTGKASDIARQLGFAGIAIIWLFRSDGKIPSELLPVAVLIIVGLAFDFLQYVYGSMVWGVYHHRKSRQVKFDENAKFTVPRIINMPTSFFFWGKVVSTGFAYIALGFFVAQQLL